ATTAARSRTSGAARRAQAGDAESADPCDAATGSAQSIDAPGPATTTDARSAKTPPGGLWRPRAGLARSPLFSQGPLESLLVERQFGDEMLQPAILFLALPKSLRLAHVHPAELLLPAVVRRLRDPMLTAQILHRQARLRRLQRRDDLLFAESLLPHLVLQAEALSRTNTLTGPIYGEGLIVKSIRS